MQEKYIKKIKLIITLLIFAGLVWLLIVSPMLKFHENEKTLEKAARRYYELNNDKLPTGERVKTLSLNALYKESYLKNDLYAPYSGKVCSLDNSWVKVKRVNGEYNYYTYLDCGLLKSSIDHKGPTIKLNGDTEMVLDVGDKYNEQGVKSVVDNTDGKMKIDDVLIRGSVDISKVGKYEIDYIAYDSLNNKGIATRTVNVVKSIKGIVKKDLKKKKNYTGSVENNYILFSNMYFRIFGLDNDGNAILVSDGDVANVNYTKIEDWLDNYYYDHITDEAKKMIVKSKYCNMKVDENNLGTTKCNSYTNKRYVYIPSVVEVNLANSNGSNFMKPLTMSWVANNMNNKKAYVTRNVFYGEEFGKNYLSYDNTFNYGVRPMLKIKGSELIYDGDGTFDNPYILKDTKRAKGGDLLNTRNTGEYITIDGVLWRIIDVMNDGTTKVIMNFSLNGEDDDSNVTNSPESSVALYNPKDKENYGYAYNNNTSKYIDTSFFVKHTVEAPVYKNKFVYGEEKKVNKYDIKFSPPNMYEMFSAQSTSYDEPSRSYWLINSSDSKKRYAGAITDIGVPLNEPVSNYAAYGIRSVGFVKKDTSIGSGKGTYNSPYTVR